MFSLLLRGGGGLVCRLAEFQRSGAAAASLYGLPGASSQPPQAQLHSVAPATACADPQASGGCAASTAPLLHGSAATRQQPHRLSPCETQWQQWQQLRFYRIPIRVLQPKVPYSVRSGRPVPQPWPAFEAIKGPPGELRWHRSVVRFPADVSATIEGEGGSSGVGGRMLAISGKAGTIRLDLQALDPTGVLAYRLIRLPAQQQAASAGGAAPDARKGTAGGSAASTPPDRCLLALVGPDKEHFDTVCAELNKAIRGVMSGYLVGLTVKGVGYRMEPADDALAQAPLRRPGAVLRSRSPGGPPKPWFYEAPAAEKQNVTFPYNKPSGAIRLKVGYSRTVVYPLPPHVRAFFLKPTLVYLYGLEQDELQRVAAEVRSVRPPNPFTGNGVQLVDEVVRLKQRASAK